jgi:hypothetical protein
MDQEDGGQAELDHIQQESEIVKEEGVAVEGVVGVRRIDHEQSEICRQVTDKKQDEGDAGDPSEEFASNRILERGQ